MHGLPATQQASIILVAVGCKGVPICGDVDELPAYGPAEQWAALFEVIAPYHKLCRVPVPANYTARVRRAAGQQADLQPWLAYQPKQAT